MQLKVEFVSRECRDTIEGLIRITPVCETINARICLTPVVWCKRRPDSYHTIGVIQLRGKFSNVGLRWPMYGVSWIICSLPSWSKFIHTLTEVFSFIRTFKIEKRQKPMFYEKSLNFRGPLKFKRFRESGFCCSHSYRCTRMVHKLCVRPLRW